MSARVPRETVRLWMDGVTTVAALAGVAILLWMNWARLFPPPPSVPESPVSLAGATLRGVDTAPVILVEYSDYLCPFCLRFEDDILPTLNQRYIETGRMQLAFKHHPIERIHPGSTLASQAALCAGRQDMFLSMHTALFREGAGLTEGRLVQIAQSKGLDTQEFSQCLFGDVSLQVLRDVKEAEALGLSGTPAFLVGRRLADGTVKVVEVIKGARPAADFEAAIERALASPGFAPSRAPLVFVAGGIGTAALVWSWYRRRLVRHTV